MYRIFYNFARIIYEQNTIKTVNYVNGNEFYSYIRITDYLNCKLCWDFFIPEHEYLIIRNFLFSNFCFIKCTRYIYFKILYTTKYDE